MFTEQGRWNVTNIDLFSHKKIMGGFYEHVYTMFTVRAGRHMRQHDWHAEGTPRQRQLSGR